MYRPEGWQATIKLDLEMPEVMAGQLADNDKIELKKIEEALYYTYVYKGALLFIWEDGGGVLICANSVDFCNCIFYTLDTKLTVSKHREIYGRKARSLRLKFVTTVRLQ